MKKPNSTRAKPKKKAGGRPAFKATDEQRKTVGAMAAYGTPHADIAAFLKIDPKTLRKHFREELDLGHIRANAQIGESLFQRARGSEWVEQQAIKVKTVEYENGKKVREEERVQIVELKRKAPPDTGSLIWWTKTRMGWKEVQSHEHTGKDGGPIQTEVSAVDFISERIAGIASRLGAEEDNSEPDGGTS